MSHKHRIKVAIAILEDFFRTEASGSRINTVGVACLICKTDTVVVRRWATKGNRGGEYLEFVQIAFVKPQEPESLGGWGVYGHWQLMGGIDCLQTLS